MSEDVDLTGVPEKRRPETLRRVGIIRRYLAIAGPTPDDAKKSAAEMGLSEDAFVRIVSAWEQHGRASALPGAVGSGARRTDAMRLDAAAAASGKVDMTGVAPARRAETLRRIRALAEYLREPDPDRTRMPQVASRLGMSEVQFRNLVRAWVRHRKPSAIPGAARLRRNTVRRSGDASPYSAIMEDAMRALAPSMSARELKRLVDSRCAQAGIAPPSKSTLYNYRREALRTAPQALELVIDRIAIDMPVATASGPSMPIAMLAMISPGGHIVDWALSLAQPSVADTAALLRALALAASDGRVAPLRMSTDPAQPEWTDLVQTLQSAGVTFAACKPRAFKFSTLVTKVVGRQIGTVRLLAKATQDPNRSPRSGGASGPPLAMADALEIFAEAVEAHNRDRGGATPGLVAGEGAAHRLASALSRLIARA